MPFQAQKDLILMKSNLTIFSFVAYMFGGISKIYSVSLSQSLSIVEFWVLCKVGKVFSITPILNKSICPRLQIPGVVTNSEKQVQAVQLIKALMMIVMVTQGSVSPPWSLTSYSRTDPFPFYRF